MSRQIADILRDLTGGQTYEHLNTALSDVVQGVLDTGKVGELSIKLKIKANGEHSVIITDEVKTKVPEKSRGETLFFATSGGSLLREDPRQEKLPLRAVSEAIPRSAAE